jgi:SAM-dependent methyltransferase
MSGRIFNFYAKYYDLIYRDKNYSKEIKYIDKLLKTYLKKKNLDILEFGSGTGKHGNLLAKLGHKVHGIELSQNMISKSFVKGSFTCQQGDIAKIKLAKSFDVVLSLFHVINYQITDKQLNAVFFNAFKHLNSKGLFILDFWYTPAVNQKKPSIKIKRVSDNKIEIIRIAEPFIYKNKNRIDVKYNIFVKNLKNGLIKKYSEVHKLKHFNLPEIKKLSRMNNFELLRAEEFLTGHKLCKSTWGGCVVLRKN